MTVPPRQKEAIKWSGCVHSTLTGTCKNCGASKTFTSLQARRGDAYVEVQPCHADDCTKMLCENCKQFVCCGCGLAHCEEHKALTVSGEEFCEICARMMMADDAGCSPEEVAAYESYIGRKR